MKNKILIVLLISIVIFSVSNISFASSSILIDGDEYLLSNFLSNYSHLLICKSSVNGYYLVVVSNSPIVVDNNTFYTVSEGSKYGINIVDLSSFLCNTSNLSDCFPNGNLTAKLSAYSSSDFIYSSYDIKDSDGNVIFEYSKPPFTAPSFVTTKEELSSGKFDMLKIDAGDLDYSDSEIVLNIYNGTYIDNNIYNYNLYKSFLLNSSSNYAYIADLNICYYIPREKLGIDLSNDKNYMFELKEKGGDTVYSQVDFTVSGLTTDEEIQNAQDETNQKLDEQTDAIKENTETNKNIFDRIGDLLSFINPFSENFFVYKLIELLINALKSLFIPSDDFLGTFFSNLKDWFSDRLGFLFYPFELILDILDKMLHIDFTQPIFNIPDIIEPTTQKAIMSATTYNLNDILQNNAFKTAHDIYLVIVDAFVIFGLVNLAKKKYEEVTEK